MTDGIAAAFGCIQSESTSTPARPKRVAQGKLRAGSVVLDSGAVGALERAEARMGALLSRGWRHAQTRIVLSWLFAVGFASSPALAADAPPLGLIEWDAPESCPDVSAVRERIATIRGDDPVDWRALGTVRGVMRPHGGGWQLTLEVFDGGERRNRIITASACDELAEAAAVALALALETGGLEIRGEAVSATGDAHLEDTAAVAEADAPASSLDGRVLAHAALDPGSLPKAALGAGVELRAELPFASFGLYGVLLPEQSVGVRGGRDVDFSLWFAGARACRPMLRGTVEGAACLGFDAGVLRAAGSGLLMSRVVSEPWLAPNAGFELGVRLWQRLGAVARAEAAIPLVRRPYVINDTESVHRPPVLAPRVFIGLSWVL
jgi:hypothetical protein